MNLEKSGRGATLRSDPPEQRQDPRFAIAVAIRIYPRDSAVIRGYTVDISESGISAMLRDEVQVGEIVRLEFALPDADIEVVGVVRQRNAFRYGFQFMEAGAAQSAIRRTCRQLAMDLDTRGLARR
jgi:c-di-GMP-binding flagellar brake protein YcgR